MTKTLLPGEPMFDQHSQSNSSARMQKRSVSPIFAQRSPKKPRDKCPGIALTTQDEISARPKKRSADTAWVSGAFVNPMIVKPLDSDIFSTNVELAVDTCRRNERGEPLPADRFPKQIWGRYPGKKVNKLPDITNASVFLVSASFADVLRTFDLGKTSLYPTKVFQHNRKTPVEGEYFCINFGERKASFLPDESLAQRRWPEHDIWNLRAAPKDDDVTLSAAALEGVDLWLEEPRFTKAFFLSDHLVKALREATLTRYLSLRRCRVIDRS